MDTSKKLTRASLRKKAREALRAQRTQDAILATLDKPTFIEGWGDGGTVFIDWCLIEGYGEI